MYQLITNMTGAVALLIGKIKLLPELLEDELGEKEKAPREEF